MKYIHNDDLIKRIERDISRHVQDGFNAIIDSLRYSFISYTPYICNMTRCLLNSCSHVLTFYSGGRFT